MCSFLVWKNACLNYREFDLEGDLVGASYTWYLSAQSFIRLLKLIWREYNIVAMNEWKKKCVGLQRTWVSKRTVQPKDDVQALSLKKNLLREYVILVLWTLWTGHNWFPSQLKLLANMVSNIRLLHLAGNNPSFAV